MKALMNRFSLVLVAAIMAGLCAMTAYAAYTAPQAPATGTPGYTPVIMPINGTFTASSTGVVSWMAPTGFQIMGVSGSAQASSGTNPTLKIRGWNAGFMNYSGTVVAGSVNSLTTVAYPSRLTPNTVQSVDLVIGGSTPSFSNITLFMYLKQL